MAIGLLCRQCSYQCQGRGLDIRGRCESDGHKKVALRCLEAEAWPHGLRHWFAVSNTSGIVVVDGIQMQVAGMPAYTDLTKAHEVANLARRLQKELRDAINDAAKYNNRERLFDMIITNVCIVCSTALCLRFTRCFMMTTMTTTTTTNLPYGDFPEVY